MKSCPVCDGKCDELYTAKEEAARKEMLEKYIPRMVGVGCTLAAFPAIVIFVHLSAALSYWLMEVDMHKSYGYSCIMALGFIAGMVATVVAFIITLEVFAGRN